MDSFDWSAPTRVIFGPNKETTVGDVISSYGFTKILVMYGQGSILKSGLKDRIFLSLAKHKLQVLELGGVQPNPDVSFVRKAIEICRNEHIEMILAIGGGSVIDSAKLTATGFYYSGDPFDINMHRYIPKKALPVGVILTIAAAGSEMSSSCVISDEKTHTKMGYNSPFNRPLFAIMNPELTYTVSAYQTAVGVVDILMHTLERYFNPSGPYELADAFAEGLLKVVMEAGKKALESPFDYDARASLMLASSLSHNGTTSLGKQAMMPVHQMEHIVSGLYPEVAHGAGLSVLFIAWGLYYCSIDVAKFDKFARRVMNLHLESPIDNAKMGIVRLKEYFDSMGMPLTFADLGIEKPDIKWMVQKLTNGGTRVVDHPLKPLDQEVARTIYESCL